MPIEITPELLNDLRQNAEAATPGDPAVVLVMVAEVERLRSFQAVADDDYAVIISRFCGNEICVESYAEFIAAANPAVVLALVAEVERLRDRLDELVCSGCDQQPKFCSCEVLPLSGNETDFASKGANNADQV
jgi:hypothetical protein